MRPRSQGPSGRLDPIHPAILGAMVIALEGLPGAGKTTAAPLVAHMLGAQVITETTADHPFLRQVYDDNDRDDLTTELAFLLVHANPYRRLDRTELAVCDFSPAKDELFAEDMLGGDDLQLFKDVYRRTYRGFELPDVTVLLRAEPELCLDRVMKRMEADPSRSFEIGLTIGRLRRMGDRYEHGRRRLGQRSLVYDVHAEDDERAVAAGVVSLLQPYLPATAS
jgi:deoxyadenosine/deoxycytidine kinase